MNRRTLISAFAALCAGRGWAGSSEWQEWKSAFLGADGRVVDREQDGVSHSEGQAYGLLLAQSHGDREAFERIEGWARANLAMRQDALMAWKWRNGSVRDWRNATDGDLLRAWALLRAERDSGWSGHAEQMKWIVDGIVGICLAPDPRASNEWLLKPADLSKATRSSVLVNPSYYVIRAMLELGEATGRVELIDAAVHGERILLDPAAPRDWVDITAQGPAPAEGFDELCAWDALRIPLYFVWSGRRGHPIVGRMHDRLASSPLADHVATVTDATGDIRVQSNAPGFRAVARLSAGLPPGPAGPPSQGYYPATLGLLAQVAWREGA